MSAPTLDHAISVMLDGAVIDALARVRALGVRVHVPQRIWTALVIASVSHENATAPLDQLRTALHLAGDEYPPSP